jgi:tetratricopeptide (TPR) repeat protein
MNDYDPKSLSENAGGISKAPEVPVARQFLSFPYLFMRRRPLIVIFGLVLASISLWATLARWGVMFGEDEKPLSGHWKQADRAFAEHEYELARSYLTYCVEASPFHAESHYVMARACRLTGDPDIWLYHLRVAEFLGWPAEAINLERRLGEAQSKNIWMVEDGLKDDVLEAPDDKKQLIVEALINGYLENDRPKDAYRLAYAWTMDSPDDWLPWLYLGRARQLAISWPEAIDDYEKVLKLKPNQATAQYWLAQTLFSDTQFERAIQHFQHYLHSNPDSVTALVGLAECQFSLGQVDAARATLSEALTKDENNAGVLFARARVEQAESPERALPWLRKAAAAAPNEPTILHNLVLVLRIMRQEKEADEYDRRLKQQQTNTNRLRELEMEVIKDANNVDLRYQIATLNLEAGNEDEAAHWFQTVLWIDPDHGPTLRALANYWQKSGNSRRARYYAGRAEGRLPRMPMP